MIYGLCGRVRIEATPKAHATCPTCNGDLRAKCGKIVAWHWAHVARDCDPWSEGESAWHLGWKMLAQPESREVVMGPHRADLVSSRGTVVELQHSPISVDEIADREGFYGNMVWVIDATPFAKNFSLRGDDNDTYFTFRWFTPRKTLLSITRPLFFDLGEGDLFEVRKIGKECPVGGWGYLRSQRWFMESYFGLSAGLDGRSVEAFRRWRLRHTHATCSCCSAMTPKWELVSNRNACMRCEAKRTAA